MSNISKDKIIKLYWTRRSYGRGANDKGAYVDYFLEDLVEDIFNQDKVKLFCELWEKKVEQIKGRAPERAKTKK